MVLGAIAPVMSAYAQTSDEDTLTILMRQLEDIEIVMIGHGKNIILKMLR